MHQVPIVGHATLGAILAHGCNDDPVDQFDISDLQGRKQLAGHGSSLSGFILKQLGSQEFDVVM